MTRSISFRSQLKGEISDFCDEENFSCAKTNEVVVQLVASLASYREEGLSLVPKVFICNDAKKMCSMLQGSQMLEIGEGELIGETAKHVLKKCAPLAIGGWSIFLERAERSLKYGLFTAINLPLSLSPAEILLDGTDQSFPIIFICQISENVVEIRGVSGKCLQIHFSAVKIDEPSPIQAIDSLIEAITKDLPPDLSKPTRRFINRIMNSFLIKSHGTLAAVLPKRRRVAPKGMRDGVLLNNPFNITEKVVQYENNKNDETMIGLLSAGSIIEGMMMSDGITLFKSDGSIIGYNIFLKGKHNVKEPSQILGGARKRTYQRLSEMVPKDLIAAFIRSQDGYMECKWS